MPLGTVTGRDIGDALPVGKQPSKHTKDQEGP
jgi:hypothetical protein